MSIEDYRLQAIEAIMNMMKIYEPAGVKASVDTKNYTPKPGAIVMNVTVQIPYETLDRFESEKK